jgi:hypothetical protein
MSLLRATLSVPRPAIHAVHPTPAPAVLPLSQCCRSVVIQIETIVYHLGTSTRQGDVLTDLQSLLDCQYNTVTHNICPILLISA